MRHVGYEHLRQRLNLTALPPWRPAVVRPVVRILETEAELQVPGNVAPGESAGLVEHILFALKHEGVDLQILAEALPHVPETEVVTAVNAQPAGRYSRALGFLWEGLTGQFLDPMPWINGNAPFNPVFDPTRYVTGSRQRSARWRVDFNGLGTLRYCATVRRTPALSTLLETKTLQRAKAYLDSLGDEMRERALSWAYLHETQASYEIEREHATEDRAHMFAALLRQAHVPRALDEQYLVELQNAALANRLEHAHSFRDEQNWLHNGARGALGVSYVPPPPALLHELMGELMRFANALSPETDSLVLASVISFGFVFLHPFMDGNGRLSRFLFHKALFSRNELPDGRLLPVSVAMKRNEADYLAALRAYSAPMRQCWDVTYIDEGEYAFAFRGTEALYRYWDATPAATFCLRMAEQALEVDLQSETLFLMRYDQIRRAVEARFDVRGNVLAALIRACLENNNTVSLNRRKRYRDIVPEEVFEVIERAARNELDEAQDGEPEVDPPHPDAMSVLRGT